MRENSSGVSAPGPPANCRLRTCSVRPLSRSSCVSPRQTMGVRPLASAIRLFLATLSSVSRKSWRRSEWPIMTYRHPASASMGAETSPVNAPSLLQETFWPEMAILVFFATSTAAEIAVKGGAMTMSQCLEFATSGANAEKNARVSASVLYIFQLPAITRRRDIAVSQMLFEATWQIEERFLSLRADPFAGANGKQNSSACSARTDGALR